MRRLQRFLAIPMGASAIAALWLLQRQTGAHGILIGVAAALVVAALLAVYGLLQRRDVSARWGAAGLAVVTIGLGVAVIPPSSSAHTSISGAERWSAARLASDVAAKRPVFVYFTADWCLSCKVNETTSIDRDEVQAAFRKAGVQVLAGDWTNGDPEITRFLGSRGRAGVPLYLWYAPGKPAEELPQVLTPGMLIARAQGR